MPVLLLVLFQNGFSQDKAVIDSLLNCLEETTDDVLKVDLMTEISNEYHSSYPDKAIEYAIKAQKLSKEINYTRGVAGSYLQLGVVYTIKGEYTNATKYYQESLLLGRKLEDKIIIASSLNNLGNICYEQGSYSEAKVYYEDALLLYRACDDKERSALLLSNIGGIHFQQSNYTKALKYFEESLKLAKEVGSQRMISRCLNMIGGIHFDQANYTKAIHYGQESLKLAEETGNKRAVSLLLNNIGEAYLKLRKYLAAKESFENALKVGYEIESKSHIARSISLLGELYLEQEIYSKALYQFEKALKLDKELGEKGDIANGLINIGQTFYELKKYGQANDYCSKGLNLAMAIDNKDNIKKATGILAKSYAKQNNFEKAYEYHVQFKAVHDSIFNIETKKKIETVESLLEIERKEQEIKSHKAQLALQESIIKQQETRNFAFIIIFMAIIVVLCLVFLLIRASLQKKGHKLREALYLNIQKTLAQQMNPHFIANTLCSIQSFIIKNKPEDSVYYIAQFGKLMRKMLYNSQNHIISLKDEIDMLKTYSELESLRLKNKFNLKIEFDKNVDENTSKIPVFLLQPLVENAIKHGIEPLSESGAITLRIEKSNEGLKCRIEDNGVGIDRKEKKNQETEHISIAGKLITKRLDILSLYYKKDFGLRVDTIKSENGAILGTVSEITIPVLN